MFKFLFFFALCAVAMANPPALSYSLAAPLAYSSLQTLPAYHAAPALSHYSILPTHSAYSAYPAYKSEPLLYSAPLLKSAPLLSTYSTGYPYAYSKLY